MHSYWGFGLRIQSEFKFPELLPLRDGGEPDVTISIGAVPAKLQSEHVKHRPVSSIGKDEYILNVAGVCRYYAGHGNTVIAEPVTGIDEHSVRLYLLGTVMAAILYQRGLIPMHASAIVNNNGLILFAGNSGAGKSTLLARLYTKGYKIFTDDICVVQPVDDTSVSGTASYPMIKLWDDALSQIDNEQLATDFKIRPQSPKYGVFFYDSFNTGVLPISKLFILYAGEVTDIHVRKLTEAEAFRQLEKHAYRHHLITDTILRAKYFSLVTRIATNLPVYEVIRPAGSTDVEYFSQQLEPLF